MKNIKITPIIIFTLLSILISFSCDKEKNNLNPTVRFIQPENDIVIEHDTVLTIIVDAKDSDGYVTKVNLLINDTIVKEFHSPPYQYYWHGSKLENTGVHTIKAIAYDDKGASDYAEISIEIKDFRIKYLGDFYFKVIKESWMHFEPVATYDTSFYDGVIRRYELIDSDNDLFSGDDSNENQNEKITIEFKQNTKITSLIDDNGVLIPKSGYHYSHTGKFVHIDTIKFHIGGLGGLGYG